MEKTSKFYILILFTIMSVLCIVFVCNTAYISNWIDMLNGQSSNQIVVEEPAKDLQDDNKVLPINTAAIGKYKLNEAFNRDDKYVNITVDDLILICNEIKNNDGKILMLRHKENLKTEFNIVCLQLLAGDNYSNVKNFYLNSFNEENKYSAGKYLDQQLSLLLNINEKDVPYLNLQKNLNDFLRSEGLAQNDINIIKTKLKEDCV